MKRKLISALLCLCMALTLLPMTALAVEYSDTEGNWAESSIDRWTDAGVVHGSNGAFEPDKGMTRAEFAQTMTNLMKLSGEADLSIFGDVDPDEWYVPALEAVYAANIMQGTGANMEPDSDLTREQMFVMIARALGVEPEDTCETEIPDIDEAESYAVGYINALVNLGVLKGTDALGSVEPGSEIDRAATMTVLDRLIGGYANEEGQTVEIEEGKVTLIVADNVTVKGEADTKLPIVVTGESKSVDMKEVTGKAVVQVNVSDVAIKNAPAGTEIKAAEDAKNVTANDIDVSGDADKDVIIPEKKPTPGSSTVTPPVNDTTTVTTIDGIIEQGRQDVNKKMMVRDNQQPTTTPYAFIEEFAKSVSPREVTVTIYDGTTQIGTVYTDIIDTLVKALQDNASKVTSITAVKNISNEDVTDPTEEGTYKKTLDLAETVPSADVILFVKALVGNEFSRTTTISDLADKSFVVEVSDEGKDDVTTKVQYKVTFKMTNLDEVIAKKIPEIDATMDYADLVYDNYTLSVNITNGAIQLGKVYDDISQALCDAFNLVRNQLYSVKDSLNSEQGSTLNIDDEIVPTDLVDFIKALKLKKTEGGEDTTDFLTLMQSGKTSIAGLVGYEFQIVVTPKGEGVKTETYTIKFTGEAPTLDEVIKEQIDDIAAKMDYAELTWTEKDHTLAVDISNGETEIGKVYDDIAKMLCDAFNDTRTTLKTVEDSLNSDDKATIDLTKDLTDTDLKAFVMKLYLQKGEDTKSLLDVLKGAGQEAAGRSSKISALDGWSFKISVTSNEDNAQAVIYTITFSGAPSLDTVIAAEIETIDDRMTYADLNWNTETHTLSVNISDGTTEIGTVYNHIAAALCSAFNKSRTTLSSVEDALFPESGAPEGTEKSKLTLTEDLTEGALLKFVHDLYLKPNSGEGDQTAKSLLDVLKTADEAASRASEIGALKGWHFEINVTDKGKDAQPVVYTITFANAQ